MPWFRVDDTLAFHEKTLAAGNAAMGLWVRSGAWSMQMLTDGHVPRAVACQLGTTAQASRLVAVGLWDDVGTGYAFHDWMDRQPSKAKLDSDRQAAAKRLAEWRAKQKENGNV